MNLEEKFVRAERSGQDSVFERIDDTHPVGIFIGLEGYQRTAMIICPERPPEPPSLASISVDIRSRQNGEWALVLRLVRPELTGLFTRLVEDLDGATRQRPHEAGGIVISRLLRWQRLLSRGVSVVLSDEELCGLMGELDFLLHEAIGAVGARAAVVAWRGPYDSPKDFIFEDVEVEVKSIHRERDRLSISSLEQLSDAGRPLFIWARIVEVVATTPGDQRSASHLVSQVREAVCRDAEAVDRLEQSLAAAGWEDRVEYETRGISFGGATCYAVGLGFPRLQRSGVPDGIATCQYDLILSQLSLFRAVTWRAQAVVDGR